MDKLLYCAKKVCYSQQRLRFRVPYALKKYNFCSKAPSDINMIQPSSDGAKPGLIKPTLMKESTLHEGICLEKIKRPPIVKQSGDDECEDDKSEAPRCLERQEPGKVIWAFIPREWYDMFVPRTGATGFFTFLFTVGTYLISKEIMIFEHNYYNGLSMAVMWYAAIKYVGPDISKALDKEVDAYEAEWLKKQTADKKELERLILEEKISQHEVDGQLIVIDAKRENICLQLEDAFRERQMLVYNTTIRKLDYQVAIADVHRKIKQKNIVEWVHKEVLKSLSPELHNKIVWKCLEDLVKDVQLKTKEVI